MQQRRSTRQRSMKEEIANGNRAGTRSLTRGMKRKRAALDVPESAADSLSFLPGATKMKIGDDDTETVEELPHNLGNMITSVKNISVDEIKVEEEEQEKKKNPMKVKDIKTPQHQTHPSTPKTKTKLNGSSASVFTSPPKTKKASQYGITPGISPFPHYSHPTPEECEEVNRLLSTVHGVIQAPKQIPQPSLTVTGCGEVPSVLDALIRTLLSGATTGKNSARAFQGLAERFGILSAGVGKGSVDWDAVRRADIKDVFEAMKSGGLANSKSRYIKQILDMVYQENQERREALLEIQQHPKKSSKSGNGPPGAQNESSSAKKFEIDCANNNVLTLDYVHALDTNEAMSHLIKYPGIGPKTAACVSLFCLQRPCFAVDTHIFRICKWLGWLPSSDANSEGKRVTEVLAYGHLDASIPDHLKYSLHQLLIRHGKTCPRCRAITGENSEGWSKGCVIDHLVKRTGKRKGDLQAKFAKTSGYGSRNRNDSSKTTAPRQKNWQVEESTDDELSDLVSDSVLTVSDISEDNEDE